MSHIWSNGWPWIHPNILRPHWCFLLPKMAQDPGATVCGQSPCHSLHRRQNLKWDNPHNHWRSLLQIVVFLWRNKKKKNITLGTLIKNLIKTMNCRVVGSRSSSIFTWFPDVSRAGLLVNLKQGLWGYISNMSMRYLNNFSKPSFVFDDEFTGYLRFDKNSNCV